MEEKTNVMVQHINGSKEILCPKCGAVNWIFPGEKAVCVCGVDLEHVPFVALNEFQKERA